MWQKVPRPKKPPESLFHGTPEELQPGDIIKPAAEIGKSASADPAKVYATESPYVAKFMAWEQNNHRGTNYPEEGEEPPAENVYHVEPVDPNEKLGFNSGIIIDPTAEPVHRDRHGKVIPAPAEFDPHTISVREWLNNRVNRSPHNLGEGNEYTSTSGYRVLSKMFDPQRTINLKKRLRGIEDDKRDLDESILYDRVFNESDNDKKDATEKEGQ